MERQMRSLLLAALVVTGFGLGTAASGSARAADGETPANSVGVCTYCIAELGEPVANLIKFLRHIRKGDDVFYAGIRVFEDEYDELAGRRKPTKGSAPITRDAFEKKFEALAELANREPFRPDDFWKSNIGEITRLLNQRPK